MNRISLALVAAFALLPVTGEAVHAASCNGASHVISLSDGRASPGSGPPGTGVRFTVTYADSAACIPSSVVVKIPGVGTSSMSTSGSDFANGATFSVTLTLPIGTHSYSFAATSGSGAGLKTATLTAVSPSSVVITSPTPAATPRPTPAPTPRPAPPPTPPPPPPATPPPASSTAAPTSSPSGSGTPSATESASERPSTLPSVPPRTANTAPSASPSASAGAVGPGASPDPGAVGGQRPGPQAKPHGTGLELLLSIPAPLMAYLTATLAGIGFFYLLTRRRRGEPLEASPVALDAIAAAPGPAPVDDTHVASRAPYKPDDADLGPEAPNSEAALPRWLRPSLREARFGGDPDRLSRRG